MNARARTIRALALAIAVATPPPTLALADFARPSIPGVPSTIVWCDVTTDGMTANCGYPPSPYSRPSGFELMVAKDVDAHPIHLAGAASGARVELIVRRDPGRKKGKVEPFDLAPAPLPGSPIITDPVWTLLPAPNLLKEFYPDRAVRMGVNGDATASCTIGPAGDLIDCWISSEKPSNQDFGTALLKITTCVKIDPRTAGGAPAPGRTIRLGAHFTLAFRSAAYAVQLVVLTS